MPHEENMPFKSAYTANQGAETEREKESLREMGSYCFEPDSPVSCPSTPSPSPSPKERREEDEDEQKLVVPEAVLEEEEEEIVWRGWRREEPWRRRSGGVMLEGYVEAAGCGEDGSVSVARAKSLTDEDLDELKGCLDLGFGFSYEEIPDLCSTLPALELCYSMSQRFLDEKQKHRSLDRSSSGESVDLCVAPPSPPIANWKISSPGDDPDDVKARLKYWAQAVACTIRLCNQ